MKKVIIIIICLTLLIGCMGIENRDATNKEIDIRIGCTTYPSSYAQALLLSVLIERQGYSVEIIQEDINNMYTSLSEGKTDVMLSSFIPSIDSYRISNIADSVIDLGSNCRNLSNGIYVPNYSLAGFISELDFYEEEFRKTIYVCKESNITIDETVKMMETYDIQYELVEVDYNQLDSIVSESIESNEWIAVALWTPNGKIDKYNLRKLKDTKKVYTNNIDAHTIINSNYNNDEIQSIVDKFYIRDNELNELINKLYQNNNKKTVIKWLDNNLQVLNRIN
ncbi:MAG: hypothetical protein N4A50_11585 [Vallitalea sp.]|jgi:ABC-type proline/glycine betaine transport system substrate-binding protein|nr:hypothetical protein [Vallitalea sp.]